MAARVVFFLLLLFLFHRDREFACQLLQILIDGSDGLFKRKLWLCAIFALHLHYDVVVGRVGMLIGCESDAFIVEESPVQHA